MQASPAAGGLVARAATVLLVLPPDRLATYARWLRLLVARSLADMARTPEKPEAPVLYLLDEFAARGFSLRGSRPSRSPTI